MLLLMGDLRAGVAAAGVLGGRTDLARSYDRASYPGLIEGHVEIDQKVDLFEQPDSVETNILFVVVPEQPAAHAFALFNHGTGHKNAPLADPAVAVDVDDEIHGKMRGKDDLRRDPAKKSFDRGATLMVTEIPARPNRVIRKKTVLAFPADSRGHSSSCKDASVS